MKRQSLTPILAACALGFTTSIAFAQATAPATTPPATNPAVAGPVTTGQITTFTGKVTATDQAKRLATIQGDQGRVMTMYVGPNVENFQNLKVGDQVSARFSEAMSLAIAKGGVGADSQIRSKVEADAATAAAPGGKPAMSAMERTTIVANVFNIDRERGIVTVRGTDGVPVDIRVPDKNALAGINKDDQLVIGFRQATAVSIEPAAKR